MKTTLLIFIFLLVSQLSYSQRSILVKPGYLGRRVLFEVSGAVPLLAVNKAFNRPIYGQPKEPYVIPNYSFLVSPELSIGYLVRENILTGIELNYMGHKHVVNDFTSGHYPGYDNANYQDYTNYQGASSYSTDYYYNRLSFTPQERIHRAHNFGANVFIEFFLRRKLTPFKFGHRFLIGALVSKVSKGGEISGLYGYEDYKFVAGIRTQNLWHIRLGYELNRRFPLKKGLYLKVAMGASIIINPRKFVAYEVSKFTFYYNRYVDITQRSFLKKAFAIQFKVGIGKI